MNEEFPKTESQEKITREQVIDAYKKFVEKGINTPDVLDPTDPEVIAANELSQKWMIQQDSISHGNEDAELRTNFEKTMLYVDAGFNDRNYLNDVLSWLSQDAQNAHKDAGNNARVALRGAMAKAMVKIRNLMP